MEKQVGTASDGGPKFRTSTKNRWLFSYLFAGLVIFIFGGVTWGYQRLLQSRRCRSQHILATRAFSPNRGGPPRRQISMHCWNPSGFQVGKAGSEFAHANLVIFLDSNLRIAKWIYGTDYSSHDVDLALKVAAGESDWIGQHSQLVYALLLFAGSILCVALSYYLLQLSLTRRASRTAAAN